MNYHYRANVWQFQRIAATITSRLKKKRPVIFEIGSRDAVDAFVLLSLLENGTQVHAFDPHPKFRELAAPFAAVEGLSLHTCAISATSGIASFYMTDTPDLAATCEDLGMGASSIKKPKGNVPGLPTTGHVETKVTCVRGDEFCAERGIMPDVIVLDVQGAETDVLRSFGDRLKEVSLVFTECQINSGISYENDDSAKDIVAYMRRNSFHMIDAYGISANAGDLVFAKERKAADGLRLLIAKAKLLLISNAKRAISALRR
jgi:FkbM family methyltransferase